MTCPPWIDWMAHDQVVKDIRKWAQSWQNGGKPREAGSVCVRERTIEKWVYNDGKRKWSERDHLDVELDAVGNIVFKTRLCNRFFWTECLRIPTRELKSGTFKGRTLKDPCVLSLVCAQASFFYADGPEVSSRTLIKSLACSAWSRDSVWGTQSQRCLAS